MRFLRGVLPLLLLVAMPAAAQAPAEAPPPRTVTVTAEGTVEVEPDRVTLRFAVVTRAPEPEAARAQNARDAEAALDAVRALGLPEEQIQLLSLRLDEDVEYGPDGPTRVGFIARRDVEVVLDDLDLLPRLVAEVVEQGANELNGIEYDLQDRSAAEDQALVGAAGRARAKAAVLASALGAGVGRVVSASEGGVSVRPPQPMFAARAEVMQSDEPYPGAYAAGQITVRAHVTVTFALE
ncbi:MAG: SIMPL domain-containing protein [Rhodothermales bacterium]|nr:SIMPL domain-containing protein [Rhodothermales bacterium]